MSRHIGRRGFISKSVAIGGAAALGGSFEESALLAHQERTAAPAPAPMPVGRLPMSKIRDVEISRVLNGCNLFGGGAHARDLLYVSDLLRMDGWQVPAYTMPADATDVAVLRIVVREGFGMDLADSLLEAIGKAIVHLEQFPPPHPAPEPGFSHT